MWHYSNFQPETLMVIETDELFNKVSILLAGGDLLSINALCLKNGEKFSRQSVTFFHHSEYCLEITADTLVTQP